MKKSRAILAGLLVLMVVSSLCIDSKAPNSSSTTSSRSEGVPGTTSSHTYSQSQTSSSSSTTTSSPCQACEIGYNDTQNGTSEEPDGGQDNTSTATPSADSGVNETSSESPGSTSTSSTDNTTSQDEASQNSTQNTTVVQLPHPFPEYRLPLDDSLIRFYIYGSGSCCKCKRLIAFINETYGSESIVRFYDFKSGENGTLIVNSLIGEHKDMLMLPITGVFYNGTLVAVISGYTEPYDVEGRIKIALKHQVVILVGYGGEMHYIGNDKKRAELESLFLYNRLPSGG